MLENEELRVGTDCGRAPRVEFGLRPDEKRGHPLEPPELVRMDCKDGEARKFWLFDVRGGWLAARSRKLREFGVSVPFVERNRLVRSASSSDECLVCGECIISIEGRPRLRS